MFEDVEVCVNDFDKFALSMNVFYHHNSYQASSLFCSYHSHEVSEDFILCRASGYSVLDGVSVQVFLKYDSYFVENN